MAKNVNNNDTLEVLRTSYNDLVDEVGGLGTLRTSQKGSLVDAVNSIIDQYFFFQDFEFDGSDGASSNRTFSGADNLGETLKYSYKINDITREPIIAPYTFPIFSIIF